MFKVSGVIILQQLEIYINTQKYTMCIQKFPDWPPGERTANGTAVYH